MGSARLGGVLVVALLLGGCATIAPPQAGFSDEEMAELHADESDRMWDYTGLPAEMRPADPPTVLVPLDEWAVDLVVCMNAAGFDNYTAVLGGYSVEGSGAQPDEEQLAFFTCSLSHTVNYAEDGYLNRAQSEYRYEYFEQVLVPCLRSHGVELYTAPTREEFYHDMAYWNPYLTVRQADQERVTNDQQLQADCLSVPPGVEDPGYNYLIVSGESAGR